MADGYTRIEMDLAAVRDEDVKAVQEAFIEIRDRYSRGGSSFGTSPAAGSGIHSRGAGMSDYTYTDADWRENAKYGLVGVTADDATEHWDRWLAAHDAKVRAEALREFASAYRARYSAGYVLTSHAADLADERADRIEKEAGL